MALDEFLFGKIAGYFRRQGQVSGEVAARTINLENIRSRLVILASAVTGTKVEIFPAEREGGYKNHNFFLPPSFSLFPVREDNYSLYLFRVLYLSVQRQLAFNWINCPGQSLLLSRQRAEETAPMVLHELFNQFPAIKELHDSLVGHLRGIADDTTKPDYTWLYGKWMQNDAEQAPDDSLKFFSDSVMKAAGAKLLTTIKARAVEEVRSIAVDKKQQEDYVLTHNFEKVETPDEFNGTWRDFDGDDELEAHSDALDELNLRFTVRVDDPVHSVYEADFVENATISESAASETKGRFLEYPEWDFAKRVYKEKFCKVYPAQQLQCSEEYYRTTISGNATVLGSLRKTLASINNKLLQQRRQPQGCEFDIDAITDLFTDIRTGHTPSEKIYLSNRKKDKDLSILLLLDVSLSSDSYVNGYHVIDIEKQVAILFGEILNEYNVDFAISGFYSKTRNHATYLSIKEFDEQWHSVKYRIGAVEPQGYTRIGAAIRHSGTLLKGRDSMNKWVVLISDGKPNDYDKYEGRYGVKDVKQALRELNECNINSYALAIEAQARYYLPQMFGQNHYQIVTKPADLIQSMVRLYRLIKYQA